MSKGKLQVKMTPEEAQQFLNKPFPSGEDLLKPLSNWHSTLYDAFGYTLPRSAEVLKNTHCRKSKKWFCPQVIRFFVNDFLHDKDVKAQLVDDSDTPQDEEVSFEPRVSAGNGIAGRINGFEFRVLKMCKGGLPEPTTDARKDYYNNLARFDHYQFTFPLMVTEKHVFKPNLVYLWNLDQKKNKVDLYLAIPKRPYLWAETPLTLIPNPITLLKQKEVEEETTDNDVIEVEKINDLRRTDKTSS